jgi:hypothetical protein
MNRAEKLLYHQIHPAKLAVDFSSCFASCALLWRGQIALAMLITWVPAIAATVLLTGFGRLRRQQESPFGRYVSEMMTPAVIAQRMAGQIVMWFGAYQHEVSQVVLGFLVIVLAWLSGLGHALPQTDHPPPNGTP